MIAVILKAIIVLAIFSALAGFTTYIERKILAFAQRRVGPMHVGPYGILQLIADGIKLFTKEDFIPDNAIKITFLIAPIIAATAAFLSFVPIPILPEFEIFGIKIKPIIADINIGILFILASGGIGMYGFLLAGLSSGNKWSLLGGARAVIQFLSFEVITGLALMAPIMIVGSLSLIEINNYQAGGISNWLIWKAPIAFILFLIGGFAETNRTPFDLLEHEAEIVSGYCTEYSGLRWGLFFIGEYAHMFVVAFLASLVFLGGYNELGFLNGFFAIILKVSFILFLFLLARATWPHIRPDQLMEMCWKILLPIALINILVTGIAIMV